MSQRGNFRLCKFQFTLVLYVLRTVLCFVIIFSSCKKTDFSAIPSVSNAHSNLSLHPDVSNPNIILILGDDVGYEIPTCDGGQTYQTPSIDAMASTGMRFTKCFTAPLCSPSRFMLMTGKYNYRNYTAWGIMDPNEKTIGTLLRDAGYQTYVAGKWQFDGGDASIHSLGFNGYCVWNPFQNVATFGSNYKNPTVYTNGQYLSTSQTRHKYVDDIFTDSALQFIKANKTKNFFVYFPITLCHDPFSPTPDDPQFAAWDPKKNISDTSYFRSMVKYMDKKIGQLTDSLKTWKLYDNTIVIYAGDNGTPSPIYSLFNGKIIRGGKASTNVLGTKVPLIVNWPGHVLQGIDTNLVDFTDFLPTLADAAGVSIPNDYGSIDGVSFYNQLIGATSTPRRWVYCYYHPLSKEGHNTLLAIWSQNGNYKLYDSLDLFFNEIKDPQERKPLTTLTLQEQKIKDSLRA